MEKQEIILQRHNLPSWVFKWEDEYQGLVHKTGKNVYKLFFQCPSDNYKPVWIGRLVNSGKAWITYEKEIKAKSIEFCGSKVFFKR